MKMLHAVLLLCGLVLGFLLAGISPADAQAERASAAHRYQISAFAGQAPTGQVFHGCYTADTSTGEMWLTIPGQAEQKVSGPRAK